MLYVYIDTAHLPVMTMAAILSLASKSLTACPSSLNRGPHRAFRALGRFNWMRPTFDLEPTTSILMFSYAGAVKDDEKYFVIETVTISQWYSLTYFNSNGPHTFTTTLHTLFFLSSFYTHKRPT